MNIYDQLRRDEGVRLKPYLDTVGKWTIGVGRNLTDKGITLEEAETLLANDVDEVILGLEGAGYVAKDDNDARYYVLVAMAFNLGLAGLLAFRIMLKAYRDGDWETAAAEMLRSRWAQQVGDRAHRLSEQLRTGEWR